MADFLSRTETLKRGGMPEPMAGFAPLFGRGQQYLLLTKKGGR